MIVCFITRNNVFILSSLVYSSLQNQYQQINRTKASILAGVKRDNFEEIHSLSQAFNTLGHTAQHQYQLQDFL